MVSGFFYDMTSKKVSHPVKAGPSTTLKKAFIELDRLMKNAGDMSVAAFRATSAYQSIVAVQRQSSILHKDGAIQWIRCGFFGLFLPVWMFKRKLSSNFGYNNFCGLGHQLWNNRYYTFKKEVKALEAKLTEKLLNLPTTGADGKDLSAKAFNEAQKNLKAEHENAVSVLEEDFKKETPFTLDYFKSCMAYSTETLAQSRDSDDVANSTIAQKASVTKTWEAIVSLPENKDAVAAYKLPGQYK